MGLGVKLNVCWLIYCYFSQDSGVRFRVDFDGRSFTKINKISFLIYKHIHEYRLVLYSGTSFFLKIVESFHIS